MSEVLLLGDIHGDVPWFRYAAQVAAAHDINLILQLGDYGFWSHTPKGKRFLDSCSNILTKYELECRWIDGNHSNHRLLRDQYGPGGPLHEPTDEGLWTIRPRLYHAWRGARFNVGSLSFLACGGAYSIDKPYRVEGKSWWREETITSEDVAACGHEPVDVLLSHDHPACGEIVMPLIGADRGKDVPETNTNRALLQQVVENTKPALVVGGHYHCRYTEPKARTSYGSVRIEGLGRDGDRDSMAILNLNTLEVTKPDFSKVSAFNGIL